MRGSSGSGVSLMVVVGLGVLGWVRVQGSRVRDDESEGYGSSYERLMKEERSSSSNEAVNVFRPRTAREAMKYAGRIAAKEVAKDTGHSFAVLHDHAMGARPMRVSVRDVHEVTTSRWTSSRFRRLKKFTEKNKWPESSGLEESVSIERPVVNQRFGPGRMEQKVRAEHNRYRSVRKPRKSRQKREVDDADSGFHLPPMSNEWKLKRKKKKKKKKKTTQAPVTKQMQTKSKKFRIYMESSELDLRKAKVARGSNFVKELSKELDNLLKMGEEVEEYTRAPLRFPETGRSETAKFVQVPRNWQKPPSWRPPTARPRHLGHQSAHRWQKHIVTIAPQVYHEEVLPPTTPKYAPLGFVDDPTTFDWRSFQHPFHSSTDRIVFKPGPDNWPEPTHPSDGIYDWHKTQIRMGRTSFKPLFATNDPRLRRPFSEESAMYRRSDMWHTRPWIPRVEPLRTWPPIGMGHGVPKDFFEEEEVHLTPGPPLATLASGAEPSLFEVQRDRGAMSANNHQHSHHYSYQYSPQHSAWQSNSQFQQRSHQGLEQYQTYQNYHANYSRNSYSQYYQNYETRLANKSAEFHYEQGHHYEDGHQVAGHYQSHYQYQTRYQPQAAQRQSRLRSPAYFFNHQSEQLTTEDPNRPVETMRAPFRAPDEYAGNDRDLRAPLPSKVVFENLDGHSSLYPTRGWLSSRFRRMGLPRRGFSGYANRFRRPMFRSIFMAPLQKDTWTTYLPDTPHSTAATP